MSTPAEAANLKAATDTLTAGVHASLFLYARRRRGVIATRTTDTTWMVTDGRKHVRVAVGPEADEVEGKYVLPLLVGVVESEVNLDSNGRRTVYGKALDTYLESTLDEAMGGAS